MCFDRALCGYSEISDMYCSSVGVLRSSSVTPPPDAVSSKLPETADNEYEAQARRRSTGLRDIDGNQAMSRPVIARSRFEDGFFPDHHLPQKLFVVPVDRTDGCKSGYPVQSGFSA
jgi:hypothetical protein